MTMKRRDINAEYARAMSARDEARKTSDATRWALAVLVHAADDFLNNQEKHGSSEQVALFFALEKAWKEARAFLATP
jgi:hypothetical protein